MAEVMLRGGVLTDRAVLAVTLVVQGSGVQCDMDFVHMFGVRCCVCVVLVWLTLLRALGEQLIDVALQMALVNRV